MSPTPGLLDSRRVRRGVGSLDSASVARIRNWKQNLPKLSAAILTWQHLHLAGNPSLDVLELSSFSDPTLMPCRKMVPSSDMSLQFNVLLHAQLLNVQELLSKSAVSSSHRLPSAHVMSTRGHCSHRMGTASQLWMKGKSRRGSSGWWLLVTRRSRDYDMALGQNLVAVVNIKIAGKWVFTPLTLIVIGFDTHPHIFFQVMLD